MGKYLFILICSIIFFSCKKENNQVTAIQYSTVSYNAVYNPPTGNASYYSFNDSFYKYTGLQDQSVSGYNGCLLTNSPYSNDQQNFPYYVGSYYYFALGNDTTYGLGTAIPYNAFGYINFSIPTDLFSSLYNFPINKPLSFTGDSNSYYTICGAGTVNLSENIYLMPLGDSIGGTDSRHFKGYIDSGSINLIISRFSNNGIIPNNKINGTMDGNFSINYYGADGSSVNITNGVFKNVLVQQN
jgi:hypothetical protein